MLLLSPSLLPLFIFLLVLRVKDAGHRVLQIYFLNLEIGIKSLVVLIVKLCLHCTVRLLFLTQWMQWKVSCVT